MQQTVYDPQKGRLETINIEFTDENTTWFDDHEKIKEIYMVNDFEEGLVIAGCNYDYPILFYDISRSDINDDLKKALDLKKTYTQTEKKLLPTGKQTQFRYAQLCLPVCGDINICGESWKFELSLKGNNNCC